MVVVEECDVSRLDDETGGVANEEDTNGGLQVYDVGNELMLVDSDAGGLARGGQCWLIAGRKCR